MPLKELNCSLVFVGCGLCLKRAQLPAFSRFRIFFREYKRYLPDFSFLIVLFRSQTS